MRGARLGALIRTEHTEIGAVSCAQLVTVDGVLRRLGDEWVTESLRYGVITHTLKIATGDERVPADCARCAQGQCVIEAQECDAWDARVIVHDPGRDERS